jgi:molybdate-binding protein
MSCYYPERLWKLSIYNLVLQHLEEEKYTITNQLKNLVEEYVNELFATLEEPESIANKVYQAVKNKIKSENLI